MEDVSIASHTRSESFKSVIIRYSGEAAFCKIKACCFNTFSPISLEMIIFLSFNEPYEVT